MGFMSKALASKAFASIGLLALLAGCKPNPAGPGNTPPPASLSFTFAPMDVGSVTQIVPLGNMNPPGHTLPTNHIYFMHPAANFVVTAPAGGTIVDVRHDADDSISVQATPAQMYYLYHLLLDPGIATGGKVTAGQRLGVTIAVSGGLDLGLLNSDVTLFFVQPGRYSALTLHTDGPLKFFTDTIRATMLPKVQRNGDEKDGKINFDVAGRLSGNWFLEGLPIADTENVVNGPKHLSFARDVLDPAAVRISIGGTIATAGSFFVQDGAIDPTAVTTASGRIAYTLFATAARSSGGSGVLIVQLIADDRIRIEVFPPGTPASADFTGASNVYVR